MVVELAVGFICVQMRRRKFRCVQIEGEEEEEEEEAGVCFFDASSCSSSYSSSYKVLWGLLRVAWSAPLEPPTPPHPLGALGVAVR